MLGSFISIFAPFIKFKVTIEAEAFEQKLKIVGPLDEDKDGNPEFFVEIAGKSANVEVPTGAMLSGLVAFVQGIISAALAVFARK
jgi:hypothetical protein